MLDETSAHRSRGMSLYAGTPDLTKGHRLRKKRFYGVMNKGEKVKLAISLGVEVETAIALFDQIERLELPKAKAAKKHRNTTYYQDHKDEFKVKRDAKNELKRIQSLSAFSAPIQSIQPIKTGPYIAKVGTPQHDAWNTWTHDRKGHGLPYSDELKGWKVASEWPPSRTGAAA